MARQIKSNKVYKVSTGTYATGKGKDREEETKDWSSYTVIAVDAKSAMSKAEKMFSLENEYVTEVEIVTVLDE
jgi:hypothetical protein